MRCWAPASATSWGGRWPVTHPAFASAVPTFSPPQQQPRHNRRLLQQQHSANMGRVKIFQPGRRRVTGRSFTAWRAVDLPTGTRDRRAMASSVGGFPTPASSRSIGQTLARPCRTSGRPGRSRLTSPSSAIRGSPTQVPVQFSVADPGCLSRNRLFSIPDPNFFHPGSTSSAIRGFRKQVPVQL